MTDDKKAAHDAKVAYEIAEKIMQLLRSEVTKNMGADMKSKELCGRVIAALVFAFALDVNRLENIQVDTVIDEVFGLVKRLAQMQKGRDATKH